MAKFDIITAAGNAYKTTWASRQYLLRLAAVPVALKLIFFTIASIRTWFPSLALDLIVCAGAAPAASRYESTDGA